MPIPTKATDTQMAAYVANIVHTYTMATPEQQLAGRTWYESAHDVARMVGNGDPVVGAGIIAALSPQKEWGLNVRLALDAGDGNVHGHVTNNLDKVRRIMANEHPTDVLPMATKTGNFYLNIASPANDTAITIDRWAYRVALGITSRDDPEFDADPGLGSVTRYATLATAYRLAARQLGELPSTVQAVTWVVLRDAIGRVFAAA